MTLEDIEPSIDTVMTAELIRLFRYAGCSPPLCHVCDKEILAGAVFRLVPHRKPGKESRDEMCCVKHGEHDLIERDARLAKLQARHQAEMRKSGLWGGYSRPSKERNP